VECKCKCKSNNQITNYNKKKQCRDWRKPIDALRVVKGDRDYDIGSPRQIFKIITNKITINHKIVYPQRFWQNIEVSQLTTAVL
jgi:hypothetical protein